MTDRRAARRAAALIVALATVANRSPAAAQAPGSCASGPGGASVAARRGAVAGAAVAGNAALYLYFKQAWWSGERADHWFVKSDWDQAFRDQDKFGHLFGGYYLTRVGDALLRSACVSPRRAMWWGAAYAAAFQLQIEVWDGYYRLYGFSPADVLANSVGTGLAVLQTAAPATQVVKPTFSYAPTLAYHRRDLHGGMPRATVDYSGQTYWLSSDLDALLPSGRHLPWPGWLRVSAGHSITDWVDPATGRTRRARRKLLLSIDVDAARLPGDYPLWRRVKRELSYYHLPAPAIELTPTLRGIAWYR